MHKEITNRERFDLLKPQAKEFIEGDDLALDPFELEWLIELVDGMLPNKGRKLGLSRQDWQNMEDLGLNVKTVRQRIERGALPSEAASRPLHQNLRQQWLKVAKKKGITPNAFDYRVYNKGMTYEEAVGEVYDKTR